MNIFHKFFNGNINKSFPSHILPSSWFSIEININNVISAKPFCLIQRCHPVHIDQITPEIIGEDIQEMSVNILGGRFKRCDGAWKTNKDLSKLWKGEKIDSSDYESAYEFNENFGAFYFKIKDINNLPFPFPRKFPNLNSALNSEKSIVSFIEKRFSKDTLYTVNYIIRVKHRPSFGNYWHGQVELSESGDSLEKPIKNKSEWQKNIYRSLSNQLYAFAFLEPEYKDPKIRLLDYIDLKRKLNTSI